MISESNKTSKVNDVTNRSNRETKENCLINRDSVVNDKKLNKQVKKSSKCYNFAYYLIFISVFLVSLFLSFICFINFQQIRFKKLVQKVHYGLNTKYNNKNYENYYNEKRNCQDNRDEIIPNINEFSLYSNVLTNIHSVNDEPIKTNIDYYVSTYEQILNEDGYSLERHKVLTKDGYINTAWRIFSVNKHKPSTIPVIITHGLLDNSISFICLKEESLVYLLLERGYEVWLNNNRGSTFSYEHLEFDSFEINSQYWDFTFHELAQFDLPAIIDYVREYRNVDKINYIGHSQGGYQLMLGYTMDPEYYNQRINTYASLGTVIRFINIKQTFPLTLHRSKILDTLYYLGIKNIWTFHEINTYYSGVLCQMSLSFCSKVITLITEIEPTNKVDYEKIFMLYYYEPGGSSTKNLIHWLQLLSSHKAHYFDYGRDKNMEMYNQPSPPEYNISNLSKISFPNLFYLGTSDPYVTKDSINDFKQLVNHGEFHLIDNFNHLDYMWSSQAVSQIYNRVIEDIIQHDRASAK